MDGVAVHHQGYLLAEPGYAVGAELGNDHVLATPEVDDYLVPDGLDDLDRATERGRTLPVVRPGLADAFTMFMFGVPMNFATNTFCGRS